MKYKWVSIILVIGLIDMSVPRLIMSMETIDNVNTSLRLQNYYSIISFMLSFAYIYVLLKFSNSNWIKGIAVMIVINNIVRLIFRFLYFRTNYILDPYNNTNLLTNIHSALFLIALLILLLSTILLFINNIKLSIRILFFITAFFGVIYTPAMNSFILFILVNNYGLNGLATIGKVSSIVGFLFLVARAYITFNLVENWERDEMYFEPLKQE